MAKKNPKRALVAIDLFSGGGGLTLGLKQAGFTVSAAIEQEPHAAATYAANHPETVLYVDDIRKISGAQLLSTSPTGCIDLIAACPPCQSFSSLTSKYKKKDLRDELIFEFERIVKELMPATIMMENVPGLALKGAHLFDPVIQSFRALGYQISYRILEVADYGVPQRRKRLVVLGSLGCPLEIPSATHSEQPTGNLLSWRTVKDALQAVPKPVTLTKAKNLGGPQRVAWNVVRDISYLNTERLRATRPGVSRAALPAELRPDCHKKNDYGFTNVYGRMSWDKPSPTITGGCTTLSKGRFGHPSQLRTISVREAASLQTFPSEYVFETNLIDRVCIIIGNALPPEFARVMAKACWTHLNNKDHYQ